jgi:hypothetical protein
LAAALGTEPPFLLYGFFARQHSDVPVSIGSTATQADATTAAREKSRKKLA